MGHFERNHMLNALLNTVTLNKSPCFKLFLIPSWNGGDDDVGDGDEELHLQEGTSHQI